LHFTLVASLPVYRDRRSLHDAARLVGRPRQFHAWLHGFYAGARMDGDDTVGLQRAQRIAKWPDRDTRQFDQFVLGDKSARRQPALKDDFEQSGIGDVAEPSGVAGASRALFSICHLQSSSAPLRAKDEIARIFAYEIWTGLTGHV